MKKLLRQSLCLVALFLPVGAQAAGSGITGIAIAGHQPVGTFGGVAYARLWGTVSGIIAPDEKVVGLAALPRDAAGDYAYTSAFEIIAPVRNGANATVLVEAENRGTPLMQDDLDALDVVGAPAKAAYPEGLGNGFLALGGISYARIAWQDRIAAGVPATAQGVGEVIMRDFGRLLGGERAHLGAGAADFGAYKIRILGGISQSAWFVDSFIAEGFNTDPVTGRPVFQGAIAIDGTGNWLALNRLGAAAHAPQAPYFAPAARPLTAAQLLHRPASDPFYIDVANYTDFYRVHASLTDTTALPARMRRYDWPGPHHAVTTSADAAATFAATRPGGPCNDGVAVALNPVSYNPFLRTLVVELAHALGSSGAAPGLPPSTLFRLGPAPAGTAHFNPLPGAVLQVPLTAAYAEPVGGVRFPEVMAPLGRPSPVSLPPVVTSLITGVCGNIGQWQALDPAEVIRHYRSAAGFLRAYGRAIDRLVAQGYLLPSQRAPMLSDAAMRYKAAIAGT